MATTASGAMCAPTPCTIPWIINCVISAAGYSPDSCPHRAFIHDDCDTAGVITEKLMKPFLKNSLIRIAPWLLPVGLLLLWQLAAVSGFMASRILPAPTAVLSAFWTLVENGELWAHLLVSGKRALTGFAIGGGIGLLLGFITGLSRWGDRLLDSSVQMVRNIPHLALIPLVILWFGIDESAKIFLVAFGTVFPIYINTYHGIRNLDPQLVEAARSYGLSGFSLFWQVI